MTTGKSFPQIQYQYVQDDNGDINCGSLTIANGADIEQINVACFLDGNFTDKEIKLTLQSVSDPARTFIFWNKDLNLSGQNYCYVSFVCDKFHVKDNDKYEMTLSMASAVDADLFAIADFEPKNNISTNPLSIPSPRVEIYMR